MPQSRSLSLEIVSQPRSAREMRNVVDARKASRSKPKRICLFGLFGMDNYGNDGSLEAMLLFLRKTWPDAELSCVCINPEKVEKYHHVAAVPIRWHGISNRVLRLADKLALTLPQKIANWFQAIGHLRKFDVLIVPGTAPLSDYRAGPFDAPYAVFRWALAARLSGTKLFFVSTGAGPIHGGLSRRMLTYAAKSACYRSFRDSNSKDFVTSLGIDTRQDEVYPDLAFGLPTPGPVRSAAAEGAARQPVTTIAVGLMDYNGWHGHAAADTSIYSTYLRKMTSLVSSLLDRGYRVRLLVGESADERAVARLQALLVTAGYDVAGDLRSGTGAGQLVVDPVHCLEDLMRQLADTSVVIAARFHNIICALKLAKPTISIGYQPKHVALMEQFGLESFCQHIEDIDVDQLKQQVQEQLDNHELYEDRIRRTLVAFQKGLGRQEKVLQRLL